MDRIIVIFAVIALIFLGPGCAAYKSQMPIDGSPLATTTSLSEPGKAVQSLRPPDSFDEKSPDYIIGPEDVLEISVWKNNDLSKTVTVRTDGQISLPLIGDVRASGLTPSALKGAIAKKLKEYKEDPTVAVIVQESNSYNIFVMGQVVRPGKYTLKSSTTLLQALSLAGGFTPYASTNKILLMRRDPHTMAVNEIQLKYKTILYGEDPQRDILLQPGDTIVVP